MFHPSIRSLRALALAAALGGAMAAAQAGGEVSVGVNVGVPLVGAYGTPVGSVGLQVSSGRGRGWGRHGGHRHGGWGLGLGLMLAAPLVWPSVVYEQPVVVLPARPDPALAVPASRPEPVVYPRDGQTAQQTEADRQACDRWATTQPAALADAAVFMRAVEACMDGRGYTLK